MSFRRATLLLSMLPMVVACGDTTIVDPMERQPKAKPFAASAQFDDGRAMRQPPAGTVPRERMTMHPEITLGQTRDGKEINDFPIPVTRELVDTGRKKFDIYCAVCHGLLGDGVSPVATQMSLRPPPNLLALKDRSPGKIFRAASDGYGLMPSYAVQLTAQERWAVAAYVEALRRSQSVVVAEAPPDIQKKLREETAQ